MHGWSSLPAFQDETAASLERKRFARSKGRYDWGQL
jgi:hypothetical protein